MAKPTVTLGDSDPFLPFHTAAEPPSQQPAAYVLLTVVPPAGHGRRLAAASYVFVAAVCLGFVVFALWPSDPNVSVVRLRLKGIRVATSPFLVLNISMALKVRVLNPDFLALDYRSLAISISYRGRSLGSVASAGGRVGARGVSYVDADLEFIGVQVIHDAFHLIEDYLRGSIPFDTVTEVDGRLRLLFFDIPVQGKISCSVHVNARNQTVVSQNCYTESVSSSDKGGGLC